VWELELGCTPWLAAHMPVPLVASACTDAAGCLRVNTLELSALGAATHSLALHLSLPPNISARSSPEHKRMLHPYLRRLPNRLPSLRTPAGANYPSPA
jgi:hypothetical protein